MQNIIDKVRKLLALSKSDNANEAAVAAAKANDLIDQYRLSVTKTIYKYPLEVNDNQIVTMPFGATSLTVAVEHGIPCLWTMVDTSQPLLPQMVSIRGTGHPCDDLDAEDYVGSFYLNDGQFVFHVFVH